MAIYHLETTPIRRSKGQSATAAAAYRAGVKIKDHRTGITHDYTKRSGVVYNQIVTPDNSTISHEALWNSAEQSEKRKDAQVARDYEIALPAELTDRERIDLCQTFAHFLTTRYGVAINICIHAPSAKGDQRNWHAHLLATTRVFKNGSLHEKSNFDIPDRERKKKGLSSNREELKHIRQTWENIANKILSKKNIELINCKSYKNQGIRDTPTIHLGKAATALERKGIQTRKERYNKIIKQQKLYKNTELNIETEIQLLENKIQILKKQNELIQNESIQENKGHNLTTIDTFRAGRPQMGNPREELELSANRYPTNNIKNRIGYSNQITNMAEADTRQPKELTTIPDRTIRNRNTEIPENSSRYEKNSDNRRFLENKDRRNITTSQQTTRANNRSPKSNTESTVILSEQPRSNNKTTEHGSPNRNPNTNQYVKLENKKTRGDNLNADNDTSRTSWQRTLSDNSSAQLYDRSSVRRKGLSGSAENSTGASPEISRGFTERSQQNWNKFTEDIEANDNNRVSLSGSSECINQNNGTRKTDQANYQRTERGLYDDIKSNQLSRRQNQQPTQLQEEKDQLSQPDFGNIGELGTESGSTGNQHINKIRISLRKRLNALEEIIIDPDKIIDTAQKNAIKYHNPYLR